MSLGNDLLSVAEHLVRRDRRTPNQANLRRAVSTAYYALFHLLSAEATERLIAPADLRPYFARRFDHGAMRDVAEQFISPPGKKRDLRPKVAALAGVTHAPDELEVVASTFVALQGLRHEADYDVAKVYGRAEVGDVVSRCRTAFEQWAAVKPLPASAVFLAMLFLGEDAKRAFR